jgi:single-strand DNA-binding protein
MNVVALHGTLARAPEERALPSGDRLVGYEVTVRRPGARAETVPVVWPTAPPGAMGHEAGDAVIVVGRVRRRFFRTGGATGSRTEVVAEVVLSPRQAKRAAAALERARSSMVIDGPEAEVVVSPPPARRRR